MNSDDPFRWPWLTGFWRTWSVIALSTLYILAYFAATFLFFRLVYYRHSLQSFQSVTLIFVMIWTSLRTAYFSVQILAARPSAYPYWVEEVLCWIPANVQVATFSLVVLFFAKAVVGRRWTPRLSKISTIVSLSINLSLLALTLTWLVLVGNAVEGTLLLLNFRYILSLLMDVITFMALAACLVLFRKAQRDRAMKLSLNGSLIHSSTSLNSFELHFITYGALAAFGVRLLCCAFLITVLMVEFSPIENKITTEIAEAITFLFYFVTELLPLMLLLIGTRRIPTSAVYRSLNAGAVPEYSTFAAKSETFATDTTITVSFDVTEPIPSSSSDARSPSASSPRLIAARSRSPASSKSLPRSYRAGRPIPPSSAIGLEPPTGSVDTDNPGGLYTGANSTTLSPSSLDAPEWESRRPSIEERTLALIRSKTPVGSLLNKNMFSNITNPNENL